jgi:hypothetical protein
MGDVLQLAESLLGVAAVAAPVEPGEAARLLGAVPPLLAGAGATPTPRLRADLDAVLTAVAEADDASRVAAAHEAGGSVPQEAAVAAAARLAERLAAGSAQPST